MQLEFLQVDPNFKNTIIYVRDATAARKPWGDSLGKVKPVKVTASSVTAAWWMHTRGAQHVCWMHEFAATVFLFLREFLKAGHAETGMLGQKDTVQLTV